VAANRSSFVIPATLAGQPVDRALRTLAAAAEGGEGLSWNRARRLLETGKIKLDGQVVTERERPVRAGQSLEIVMNARAPRAELLSDAAFVYVDTQVVVVEKPAGVSSVPFDENERDALSQLVERKLADKGGRRRAPIGIVHRLDRETSGLLMFSRTLEALREIKNQFRQHTVRRRYWAVVEGAIESRTISSRLIADRGDGRRGSVNNPTLGRLATTHVRQIERLRGATLIECRLETGRTHQIRIHLAEAGHPLLGERVYGPKRSQPLAAPRVLLHAFELGFTHPTSGRELIFGSEMPADMRRVLSELGATRIPTPGAESTPGRSRL
jgi:23S rRNA pseudouridine1911/1915/1917 synthase